MYVALRPRLSRFPTYDTQRIRSRFDGRGFGIRSALTVLTVDCPWKASGEQGWRNIFKTGEARCIDAVSYTHLTLPTIYSV